MASREDLRKRIAELGGNGSGQGLLGKVVDVDTTERTCTLNDGDVDYYDIRLQCITGNDKGAVIIPVVGSFAYALAVDNGYQVIGTTEVDKMLLDANSVEINGGQNGGLINIGDLVTKLNALVQSFNTHIHTCPNGSTTVPTVTASTFNKSDFEDTKIKH